MKLPEPVRQAWLQHRKTLLRIAGEPAGGRLLIGGGTVLAARWGHRLSEDIDVLLPDREVVSDAHPGGPNDLARQTGGRIEGKWRDRIKVRVEHGVLDICAMQPEMQGLERSATVEDETATVLSTAQILRGKLNRTHQGLARDAFDLVAAAKVEPRALEHAVNALDKTETDLVQKNLQDANDEIADAAEDALKGVTKGFETDISRLGMNAADAVGESRYTRVRIVLEERNLEIERWTAAGMQPAEPYPGDQIAEALLESGIGEYLKVNHLTHESMAGQGIAELWTKCGERSNGEPTRRRPRRSDRAELKEYLATAGTDLRYRGGQPACTPDPESCRGRNGRREKGPDGPKAAAARRRPGGEAAAATTRTGHDKKEHGPDTEQQRVQARITREPGARSPPPHARGGTREAVARALMARVNREQRLDPRESK